MNSRTFAIAIAFSACTCASWVDYSACAQDPFDDLGNDPAPTAPRGRTNADASDGAFDTSERDAVVRSLRANPPRSPEELARAIQWMTRIQRWDEAGRWLSALGQTNLDPQTALNVYQRAGSKAWLDIEGNASAFDANQLGVVAKIRELADQAIHSPAALTQNIRLLYSDSKTDRLAGFQGIKAAGYSGIAAMVNSVIADGGVAPNASMIEAFSLLGPAATRAWQAAMSTLHDDARERLIQLVARAPQPDMGVELLAALHDPKVSEATKRMVSQALLDRDQPVPSDEQAYRYALKQVEKSIANYRDLFAVNDLTEDVAWRLQNDGRVVQPILATSAEQQLSRASQAGLAALRLSAQSDIASAKAVAAHLEHRSHLGDLNLASNAEFQKLLPESLRDSHEFASLIWDAAVQDKLPGAQALAVSNLSRWSGTLQPVPVRDRLVAATRSGYPFVRYPAAEALMNSILSARNGLETPQATADSPSIADDSQGAAAGTLSPSDRPVSTSVPGAMTDRRLDSRFEGRSRLDAVGREMQQLLAEPLVLIVGGSGSLRGHMHGLVDQLGFRFMEAGSVADVFETLRGSVPVEAIFIVDHLRDMDLGQLIQRVRSNPSTSAVPIALLADSLSRGEHSVAASDPRVVMGSVPPEVDGLGDILRRLQGIAEWPRVDSNQRILWKESAINYFKALGPGVRKDGTSPFADLLATTQEEQQNLLRIAADADATVSKREQASRIFVQSVRRFGLLISSETSNAQYDVYNARGENEPVTRAVLGRILDAIEASTGQRSWADVSP